MDAAAKYLLLPLTLLLLIAASPGGGQQAVGVIVPLTGPVAEIGEGIRNAVMMADKEFDAEGKVTFVFEDNQYDARSTVLAVQKLLSSYSIKGLVVFGADPSLAVAEIVERARIPTISIATSKEVSSGRRYIIRHHLTAETESTALASEVQRRNYESIALVTTQNDGVLPVRDNLREQLGKRVIFDAEVPPADRDLSSIALRIKRANPPAAVLCLMPPQTGILAKRLIEAGYTGALAGCHPTEIDPETRGSRGSLVGAWFVGTDERAAAPFLTRYNEAYGSPAPVVSTNGYDIAKLFINAIKSGDINLYLHSVQNFEGALGRYQAGPDGSFDFRAAVKLVTPTGIVYQ